MSDGKWDVFIAYASPDLESAEALYELLAPRLQIFLDRRRIRPGDEWDRALARAQENASITVALLSQFTSEAWYQRHEIQYAIAQVRKPQADHLLVPIYLPGGPGPEELSNYGLGIVHGITVSDQAPLSAAADQIAELVQTRRGVGERRPRCLMWTARETIDMAAALRVCQDAGLDLTLNTGVPVEGSLPWHALRRAASQSMLVVMAEDAGEPVMRALAGRPIIRLSQNASELANSIRQALELVEIWIRETNKRTLQTGQRLPPDLFDLPVTLGLPGGDVEGRPLRVEEELFPLLAAWTHGGHKTVVTGLPGSGKSVLLTRFCVWLRRQEVGLSGLPALGVVMRADDLDTMLAGGGTLRGEVGRRVSGAANLDLNLLDALLAGGRLHLIVDGFDEFATRNAAATSEILESIADIGREGASVVLACRSNFWDEQVRDPKWANSRVRISKLGAQEARHLLTGIPLPPAARSPEGEIAAWLRSPLLVRYLRQLHFHGDRATLYSTVRNRSEVYRQWGEWVSREAARRNLHPEFWNVCADIALQFVERRRFHLDSGVILERINKSTFPHGYETTLSQLDALEVFERTADHQEDVNPATAVSIPGASLDPVNQSMSGHGLRFHHETVLEYFASARLCEDFLAVLDAGTSPDQLGRLALARLTLDYFQSSVYGFIDELLEPHRYRQRLCAHLSTADLSQFPDHLLRNLIEYLGLTARDDSNVEVAILLATIVGDPRRSTLIRYNAARALERAHPKAPRPYFEWVSDWGETDFTGWTGLQITALNEGPWVMRGWKALAPACRRYITFAFNRSDLPAPDDLQQIISEILIDTMEHLLIGAPEVAAIRVNVTLCLIRWWHPAHYQRWLVLCERARQAGIEPESLENLERWVMWKRGVTHDDN